MPLPKGSLPGAVSCAQPWSGLQIAPDNSIRPCCMYNQSLGSFEDVRSIEKAFNSPLLQETRQSFEAGRWPKPCTSCRVEEDLSGTSPRVFSPGLIHSKESHEKQLRFNKVEIFLSNHCNLDCIMCGPTFSSKWNAWVPHLNGEGINFRNFTPTPPRSISPTRITQLAELCSEAQETILIGGEPLANRESLDFIKLWTERNRQGTLTIITNGTLFSEEVAELLGENPRIFLIVSIDGRGPLYEWIRGYPWSRVEQKLRLMQKAGLSFVLSPTIGAFNFLGLADLVQQCNQERWRVKLNHFLREPSFLRVGLAPLAIREMAAQSLENLQFEQKEIFTHGLLKNHDSPSPTEISRYDAWIKFFNKVRGFAPSELNCFGDN